MKITIHQPSVCCADIKSSFAYLGDQVRTCIEKGAGDPELHLFPELFLSNYPIGDYVYQLSFQKKYEKLLLGFCNQFDRDRNANYENDSLFLFGGLEYVEPEYIYNSIYSYDSCDNELKVVYRKNRLPDHDVFYESRYFKEGKRPFVFNWQGKSFATMICEDIWPKPYERISSPAEMLKNKINEKEETLDYLIVLNASPWSMYKQEQRQSIMMGLSEEFRCKSVYVNKCGAEDELIYDGTSFICNNKNLLYQVPSFKFGHFTWTEGQNSKDYLPTNSEVPRIHSWSKVLDALCFGIREYHNRVRPKGWVIALSGGLDSALVLFLLRLALPKDVPVQSIFMPSEFSSQLSLEIAEEVSRNLSVPLRHIPIKFSHKIMKGTYEDNLGEQLSSLAEENIQARLRSCYLLAYANSNDYLVANTSNKSEIFMGYSTLYGDAVGAIAPIGDLFKTEVFSIAKYINEHYKGPFPNKLIERSPSAELRENQKDEDSLLPYDQLDQVLSAISDRSFLLKDFLAKGFLENDLRDTIRKYTMSEYKRRQFCPILKVHEFSFGVGNRMPVNFNNSFFLEDE